MVGVHKGGAKPGVIAWGAQPSHGAVKLHDVQCAVAVGGEHGMIGTVAAFAALLRCSGTVAAPVVLLLVARPLRGAAVVIPVRQHAKNESGEAMERAVSAGAGNCGAGRGADSPGASGRRR